MIVDRVENAYRYAGLGPHIDAALRFLQEADLATVEKVDLDEGNVRGGAFVYTTKTKENCVIETHKVDADIHVCLEGVEVIGYASTKDAQLNGEYNAEKDKQFWTAQLNYIRLTPGMFAVMLQDDVHSVMIAEGEPKQAKKMMIKAKF
ncbi:MAG: YhcH/YjgK/YiaL family protein [Erysipelotrichaceae bacterium]|nr:YhcH/YjgK/YiaL family protein [Erysipelotrichaceae bacterium]